MAGDLTATLFIIRKNLRQGHRITIILKALSVPSRTYYDWLNWRPSQQAIKHRTLCQMIQVVHKQLQHTGMSGSLDIYVKRWVAKWEIFLFGKSCMISGLNPSW